MEAFIERMCGEHRDLTIRINNLINYINSPKNKDNRNEFALKFYQLKSMIGYEDALRNRLTLAGVTIANGKYFDTPMNLEEINEEDKTTNSTNS